MWASIVAAALSLVSLIYTRWAVNSADEQVQQMKQSNKIETRQLVNDSLTTPVINNVKVEIDSTFDRPVKKKKSK